MNLGQVPQRRSLRLHLNEPSSSKANPIYSYPDPADLTNLAAEVAAIHGVQVENVLVTPGADAAIDVICRSTPQGTVTLLDPDWVRYQTHAENAKHRVRLISIGPPPFKFPARALSAVVDTQLMIVSSVANPTGVVLPEGLVAWLSHRVRGGLIVVDETYSDFIGADYGGFAARNRNVVAVRSLSKVGFPGLRVGYILGHPETLAPFRRFVSPFAITTHSLHKAHWAVRHRHAWEATIKRQIKAREHLEQLLAARGIQVVAVSANFVLANFGVAADRVVRALAERNIRVQHQLHSDLSDCVRISTPNRALVEYFIRSFDEVLEAPFLQSGGLLEFKDGRPTPQSLVRESFATRLFGQLVAIDHLVVTFREEAELASFAQELLALGSEIVEGPAIFPDDFCTHGDAFPADLSMFFTSVVLPSGGILVLAAPHDLGDQLDRFVHARGSSAIHHVAVRVRDIPATARDWGSQGFIPLSEVLDDGSLVQQFLRNREGQILELIHRRSQGKETFSCNNIAGLRLAERPTQRQPDDADLHAVHTSAAR